MHEAVSPPDDPVYVASRRALLDALEALSAHRAAITLVGAQAIYLRTAGAQTTVAAYTSDADLAVDPSDLAPTPALEGLMAGAGFTKEPTEAGRWRLQVVLGGRSFDVPVDLMVPEALARGRSRRSVEMSGHDRLVARRTLGLEASMVDRGPLTVPALELGDIRQFTVQVAGPGGLLVAKVHKIRERFAAGRAGRELNKDAADVYRLFQGIRPADMASALRMALRTELAARVTAQAIDAVAELFGTRRAAGVRMVVEATDGVEATVGEVCAQYTAALGRELTRGTETSTG